MKRRAPAWPVAYAPLLWGAGSILLVLRQLWEFGNAPIVPVLQLAFMASLVLWVGVVPLLYRLHPHRPRFVSSWWTLFVVYLVVVLLWGSTWWLLRHLPIAGLLPVAGGVAASLALLWMLRVLVPTRSGLVTGFGEAPEDNAGAENVFSVRQMFVLSTAVDRVCGFRWIDASGSPGRGTGFLVGPDLVMTARHVVDHVRRCDGRNVTVDFAKPEQTTLKPGTVAAWLVGEGSQSDNDDWAVVRLEQPMGERRVSAGSLVPRGWYELRHDVGKTVSGAPMIVMGFQDVEPTHGTGSVAPLPQNTFVFYSAGAAAGTSGGPCFASYQLAAVHKGFWSPTANRGVRLEPLLDAVERILPS